VGWGELKAKLEGAGKWNLIKQYSGVGIAFFLEFALLSGVPIDIEWFLFVVIVYFMGMELAAMKAERRKRDYYDNAWVIESEIYRPGSDMPEEYFHLIETPTPLIISNQDYEAILQSQEFREALDQVILQQQIKQLQADRDELVLQLSALKQVKKKTSKEDLDAVENEIARIETQISERKKERWVQPAKYFPERAGPSEAERFLQFLEDELTDLKVEIRQLEKSKPEEKQKRVDELKAQKAMFLEGLSVLKEIVASEDEAQIYIYNCPLMEPDEFYYQETDMWKEFANMLIVLPCEWSDAFKFQKSREWLSGYQVPVQKTKAAFVEAGFPMNGMLMAVCRYCNATVRDQVEQVINANRVNDVKRLALAKVINTKNNKASQYEEEVATERDRVEFFKREYRKISHQYRHDVHPPDPWQMALMQYFNEDHEEKKEKKSKRWLAGLAVSAIVVVVVFVGLFGGI